MRRLLSFLCLLVSLFLVSGVSYSQETPTGSLVGTVTDPQNAAVVGAKVTVTDMAGGKNVSVSSGEGGHFTVANLSPATYRVTIEKAGFKTAAISNITIIVGKVYELPTQL